MDCSIFLQLCSSTLPLSPLFFKDPLFPISIPVGLSWFFVWTGTWSGVLLPFDELSTSSPESLPDCALVLLLPRAALRSPASVSLPRDLFPVCSFFCINVSFSLVSKFARNFLVVRAFLPSLGLVRTFLEEMVFVVSAPSTWTSSFLSRHVSPFRCRLLRCSRSDLM